MLIIFSKALDDTMNIKELKEIAHLTAFIPLVITFFSGIYIRSYFMWFQPMFKLWQLFWAFLFLYIAWFDPIINTLNGWGFYFIGSTDYFDLFRQYLSNKLGVVYQIYEYSEWAIFTFWGVIMCNKVAEV